MNTAYETVVKDMGITSPDDLRKYADREDTGSTLRDRCLFRWLADQWEETRERVGDLEDQV